MARGYVTCAMAMSRTTRLSVWIGIPVLLIAALAAFWRWDWFIPAVESRASAALKRPVTIGHMHVALLPGLRVVLDDLTVGNPPGWRDADPPLVKAQRLTVAANVLDYVVGRGLVLTLIAAESPRVFASETADGTANFRLAAGGGGGGPGVQIGDLRIDDGQAHVVIPKLKSDFTALVTTTGHGQDARIDVRANGTYAAQPITAVLSGGGLLNLRDASHPWPVKLDLANGPTKVLLEGTLRDPVAFKGANVTLRLAGPDLGLLEPLVGFPIPKTPAYEISGRLGLDGVTRITFDDIRGKLGSSDIEGTVEDKPGDARPVVTVMLRSRHVDLADLNGFIGGTPGRANTQNATAQQRQAVAQANASPRLLPDTPISVPRLQWADIHLRYRGDRIEGRNIPLDNLTVAMDVVNGRIVVRPISFGVGKGRLLANVELTPQSGKEVHAKVDLHMQNVDVSRLMAATHTFQGAGLVSGVGAIDSTGASLAALMGNGNGEVKMAMAGGDLSALLVDLTGLQFGNALLSALGVPSKTPIQCFVGDLGLERGLVDFKVMTLDTSEGITNVGGNVNLADEKIDLNLKTDSKHFSVGSLPTRISIGGTFKDPSIRPGAEVAARAGAAAGLAVLFAPLAILPTVQFGTSDAEDARCGALFRQAKASAGGAALPAPPPPAQGAAR